MVAAREVAMEGGETESGGHPMPPFRSISAFAPICHPTNGAWGQKAFEGYLGSVQAGETHDATLLTTDAAHAKEVKHAAECTRNGLDFLAITATSYGGLHVEFLTPGESPAAWIPVRRWPEGCSPSCASTWRTGPTVKHAAECARNGLDFLAITATSYGGIDAWFLRRVSWGRGGGEYVASMFW